MVNQLIINPIKIMVRSDKTKIIYDIVNDNNLNMTTMMYLLALTTDKGLTKLVKELQEKYPKK